MKLYATVTSERASKGQGGNKYLHVIVTNEDKINVISLNIAPYDSETSKVEGYIGGKRIDLDIPTPKGNKQKTAKYYKCNTTNKGITEHEDGKIYCDNCWY